MATTNVPSIQFTPTGVVLPAESAILAGEFADMQTAFGGGMSESLSSPQGQLAQSFSAIIGDKNDQIALLANQFDPAFADGRFQDALANIYFIQRIPASGTLVAAMCVGLAGTVIPSGSLAQDTSGNQYASLGDVTIPSGGSVIIQFQCLVTGPIACPIGALNTIYRAIPGWDSITNLTAGVPGVDVESRADFEYRRQQSVATNAVNSIQAVLASVLAVPDVLDAYVTDNSTNATVNTGPTSYPIIANSIYVAVAGGATADVAKAIWEKKSLGCSYNGSTTYTYTDTSQGVPPYPSYVIKWQTPTAIPIYFAVSLVNNPALPADIVTRVKNAIVSAFTGADGGIRARIASTLYASRYYAGISAIDPANVDILSLFVGKTASPVTTSTALGIDQLPTLDPTNITVTLV